MARVVNGVTLVLSVLVLAAALAAVVALFGDRDPWLDLLSHFALVYGAVGLSGLAWALAARRLWAR